MSGLKPFEKQSPEQAGEYVDRQEEARPTGVPAFAINERAAGNEAVDVGVMRERLSPGVKDGEETNLAAKMARIRGNGLQRRRHRIEQDRIDYGLVVEGDLCCFRRYREYDVEVRHWKKVCLAISKPLIARRSLALRTMPVATGVIRSTTMAAVFTGLEVITERCSSTGLDSRHDAALHAAEMTIVGETVSRPVAAEYIRHLQFGTHRRCSGGRHHLERQAVERTLRLRDRRRRDMGIAAVVERLLCPSST